MHYNIIHNYERSHSPHYNYAGTAELILYLTKPVYEAVVLQTVHVIADITQFTELATCIVWTLVMLVEQILVYLTKLVLIVFLAVHVFIDIIQFTELATCSYCV